MMWVAVGYGASLVQQCLEVGCVQLAVLSCQPVAIHIREDAGSRIRIGGSQ